MPVPGVGRFHVSEVPLYSRDRGGGEGGSRRCRSEQMISHGPLWKEFLSKNCTTHFDYISNSQIVVWQISQARFLFKRRILSRLCIQPNQVNCTKWSPLSGPHLVVTLNGPHSMDHPQQKLPPSLGIQPRANFLGIQPRVG